MPSVNNTLQLTDRMSPVLRNIIKALDSTLVALAGVDKVSQKSFTAAQRAVEQATKSVNDFRNSLNNANNAGSGGFDRLRQSVVGTDNAVSNLTNTLKTLLITYGLIQGTQALITSGDTYIGNTARLDLMNDGLQTTAELQDRIYEASQRSLGSYREMQHSVAKLGITAGHAFKNNKEMITFAELMNKQFTISGATPWEKSAGMYQLTQAMSSGRLQGDEFRSIIENAPLLAKSIRDYMNMDFGQLKEASRDGIISADIIKNALFKTAEDVNNKFAEMPMRFGDLWQQILNKIDHGLQPIYRQIAKVWNNIEFQKFLNTVTEGFITIISYIMKIGEYVSKIINFISDNWDVLGPVIIFLGTIIGLIITIQALIIPIIGAVIGIAGAFMLLNNPIGIALLIIGAIIAAIYILVGIVNRVTGLSISATGLILGGIYAIGGVIWWILGLIVTVVGYIADTVINYLITCLEVLANAFVGGFTGWIGGVKSMFGSFIDWAISTITPLIEVWDKLRGTNYASVLRVTNSAITNWANKGKTDDYITFGRTNISGYGQSMMKAGNPVDMFKSGYTAGENLMNKVKDPLRIGDKRFHEEDMFGDSDLSKMLQEYNANGDTTAKNTGSTAKNTKAIADGVRELTDADVDLLKEYARIQFVNRFTTMTPNVTANFGDVRETADVNGILETVGQSVLDALTRNLAT